MRGHQEYEGGIVIMSLNMELFRKMPKSVAMLCFVIIFIPDFFDNYDKNYIDDMSWFLLLFPCFIFSYYLGVAGGLFAAIIGNVYHLFWYFHENKFRNDGIINEELSLHIGVAVVTFFCSIGVGIISDKLKRKQIKLQNLNEKLKQMALYDYLTGLPNRNYFMEILVKSLRDKEKGSLMFIDLDGFKKVNDIYGHEEGDNLLKEIAKKLNVIRDDFTFVTRLGGDEFTVLINEANEEESINLANRILTLLHIKIHDVQISASIGIALYKHGSNPSSLLKNADLAMYKAKSRGKNSIFVFQS
jgi:diguanylate cyclase (GGDEF)-like protein